MAEQSEDLTVGAKALPLLVASDDPTTLAAIRALVADAEPPVELTPSHGLDSALAQDAQPPILVPVRMPLDHLHRALQAGEAPEPALAAWRETHDAVLRSCRKARRRVLVIDAGMFAARPGDCARALGERLGLSFAAVPAPEAPADPELASVHAAIAASLLAGDSQVREIADELEAMVLGPASPRSPAREDLFSAAETVAELSEERNLLRENLKQMLAEIEDLRAALAQTSEANDMLTEERDLLRENLGHMLEEIEKLLADQSAREEVHLLRAQLEAVNRQLEDARARSRRRDAMLGREILRLAAREREAQAQTAQAHDEIAQLHASTSWKVTRPMRALRRGIARG